LVENIVARPLTRLDVIRMAVHCLVADSRLETFAAGSDGTVVDPDVNVVFYSSPHDYLSRYSDAGALDDGDLLAVGTAAYKGWIPNQDSDGGRLKPDAPASMAFAACVLARALARFTLDSTEYTGILIDMRRLDFIPRASAMWILSGGDPECGCGDIRKIYPDAAHPQSGPFYTAPGVLGYYGTCEEAMAGRAGSHPLVICALDWAQCDWSGNQSEPALRRGGGNGAPITHFSFTRGTPPLILISSEDASRLQQFDRRTLLARMGRVAMVHPGWEMGG
jgi:hypothetical protein